MPNDGETIVQKAYIDFYISIRNMKMYTWI